MATSAKKGVAGQLTQAMTKKPLKRKVPCGVCQGPIVDEKDEALLCEGECGLWFHRGCASVPPPLYKTLSNSDEPFICIVCTNLHLKREIVQLKRELSCLTDIRDKYSTLTAEVATLRQLVNSLKTSMPPKRTYARAVTTASTTSSTSAKSAATAPNANPPKPPKIDHS